MYYLLEFFNGEVDVLEEDRILFEEEALPEVGSDVEAIYKIGKRSDKFKAKVLDKSGKLQLLFSIGYIDEKS